MTEDWSRKKGVQDTVLKLICRMCVHEIDFPGGLLFSPPDATLGMVEKKHLCEGCYNLIDAWIENERQSKIDRGHGVGLMVDLAYGEDPFEL